MSLTEELMDDDRFWDSCNLEYRAAEMVDEAIERCALMAYKFLRDEDADSETCNEVYDLIRSLRR
jgi:hypothetical protein